VACFQPILLVGSRGTSERQSKAKSGYLSERSALEAIWGRYPATSGSIFLASFSIAGEAKKCWLPISHLNTLPLIFGQINPTLDILFDLAWQSVCSSFFRPTPIPFREWLVLRDLVRRRDAIRDKFK
jgi:hypothetical protein